MIRQKQETHGPVIIDLTGPDGNAFALMGYAKSFAKQLGWDKVAIQDMINEMMDGDYEQLLLIFDRHFGEFVILER
jgi:3-deoxy-D-arabino-heptulosonate 7-phosphate (DAHP) synthase